MASRPLTQPEIARRLGVSVATISRVVNDQPGVSNQLRQQVLQVLQELRYTPNANARSLATDQTSTVGFVVAMPEQTGVDDPFYSKIMAGVEAQLASRDYQVLLTTIEAQPASWGDTLPIVAKGRVDGLIIAGPPTPRQLILNLIAAGTPIVLVDNCLPQQDVNCILSDNEGGLYEATRHMVQHGHRHIAFLCGPTQWVSNHEREVGYRRAMAEAGLQARVLYAKETTIASGQKMLDEGLTRWPELTAICAANDPVAIGAIRAAQQRGRRVPRDLAVIGYDDIAWAALNSPPLTTVHVYKRRMGQLAALQLLELLEAPETVPARSIVATDLVIRESCGCQGALPLNENKEV